MQLRTDGALIRRLASASNLSLAELARQCGVSRQRLRTWIVIGSVPRTAVLRERLCRVLGVEPTALFRVEGLR